MSYWAAATPNIFTNDTLALFKEERFVVVDAGAAGEMFDPFASAPDQIEVVAFEPRGAAAIGERPHALAVVPGGIWSSRTKKTLHVASVPETSSIYPPNEPLLSRFDSRLGVPPRRTVETPEVELFSIDAAVAAGYCRPPHFIKLDVHSAEYEALIGAEGGIDRCLGVMVETWDAPIHEGQHLNGEVETLLHDWGFELMRRRSFGSWRHEFEGEVFLSDRPQNVCGETLFIRTEAPDDLVLFHVALLELFGYGALARLKLAEYVARGVVDDRDGALAYALASNAAERETAEQARLRVERLKRKKLARL